MREGIAARLAGIPDIHYGEDSHWVSGDRGVSKMDDHRHRYVGRAGRGRGRDLFELRDGKIAHKDSYWKIVDRQG